MKYTKEDIERVAPELLVSTKLTHDEVDDYFQKMASKLIIARLELEQANLEIERLRNVLREPG